MNDRLMIAGTNSGCGKTTVTCALLSAFKARGMNLTAFKCGPDYIDPMFHRAVSGIGAYNLDPFFLDGSGLRAHLASHAGALSVIEGAMGYYDGIAATDEASAFKVASETLTPVVLVVNAQGAGNSLSAVIEGFARHRNNSFIKGVIFNGADEKRYPDLERIAGDAGIRAYGTIPRNENFYFPNRRLGLLAADEVKGLRDKLSELGRQAELTINIDGLLSLSKTAPDIAAPERKKPYRFMNIRLAVARDEAFCFLYEENLETLKDMGCETVFFSPLKDKALPAGIKGLYLCGGYPELYAKALSENESMTESVRNAVRNGLPAIAEGGGFIYLHEALNGYPMCGVIPGVAFETKSLQRFGYISLTAAGDNLLCKAGETLRAHEFHYCESQNSGGGFMAQKAGRELNYPCVHASDTLYAGFPQLYFPANLSAAENFIKKMSKAEHILFPAVGG